MDVWTDLISASTVPPPAEPITLSDLSAQTLLVTTTILLGLMIIGWLWPSSKPFAQLELLWTVAPRDWRKVESLVVSSEVIAWERPQFVGSWRRGSLLQAPY